MNPRLKKIQTGLTKNGLDAFLVSSPANITYLTDYAARDSYLLISKKKNIFITDGRYIREAKLRLRGLAFKRIDTGVFKAIADVCRSLKVKNLGFEEKGLSFAGYAKIRQELHCKIDLTPTCGIIEESRLLKAPKELENIRKATAITIEALKFIRDFLRGGIKEIEIAAELEKFVRYNGASSSAFDIIVASGPNSCFPHHLTSERKLKNCEPVLIDIGVEYSGYKSDLTRVFFLGKINPLVLRIYDIVKRAQEKSISRIKPGARISDVDRASRQYIGRAGYGKFFSHACGHGIGLEIHEGPNISPKSMGKLKRGMVFTVEPAIYLPARFGIRLEDMVAVTDKGVELISGALNK